MSKVKFELNSACHGKLTVDGQEVPATNIEIHGDPNEGELVARITVLVDEMEGELPAECVVIEKDTLESLEGDQ